MQFCKTCGGALNLFETNDEQICRSCEKKEAARSPRNNPPHQAETSLNGISGATFSIENNMLTLKAKEGWVLWSGPADKEVALDDIMKRAHRIHQIRSKRKGLKN